MEVSDSVLIALFALAVVSFISYRWGFSREGSASVASPEMPFPRATSKPRVFISYRRADSEGHVLAIRDRLTSAFGSTQVFKDTDNISPGRDFTNTLGEEIARSDVMLAVIGKQWLTETNRSGVRRIDDPADAVRIELETALQRGIPVIPVLVGGAAAPKASELPPALSRLRFYNFVSVDNRSFDRDVDDLIQRLQRSFAEAPEATRTTTLKSHRDDAHGPRTVVVEFGASARTTA